MRNAMLLLIGFLALIQQNIIQAQTTGLPFDDATYNALPVKSPTSGIKYIDLPLSVDLTPFCPIPGEQGNDADCTAWATAYTTCTALRAMKSGITDRDVITRMALSVKYLYNQVMVNPDDCRSGAYLTDVLNLLLNKGDVLYSEFNGDCYSLPTDEHHIKAQEFKIKDYIPLFNTDEPGELKVEFTRASLADSTPVVVGLQVTPSLLNFIPGQVQWDPTLEEQPLKFGHAVVVIGYDERRNAFLLMNSWGKDWGDEGRFWMNYDDFGRLCKYGFHIFLKDYKTIQEVENPTDIAIVENPSVPNENPNRFTEIKGDFQFRVLKGVKTDNFGRVIVDENGKEIVDWETLPATHQGNGVYTLNGEPRSLKERFQFMAFDVPAAKYVYVFSIDPDMEMNIHWPRTQEDPAEPMALGYSESPIVFSEGDSIIIPGANTALRTTKVGKEYLVVLYSDLKIEDFSTRAQDMAAASGPMDERLSQVFGDLLFQREQITYSDDRMHFDALCPANQGMIVPIILEAEFQ